MSALERIAWARPTMTVRRHQPTSKMHLREPGADRTLCGLHLPPDMLRASVASTACNRCRRAARGR